MRRFICVVLICMASCALAWGQGATAQIHGVVQDTSGASVPGAAVKATQTATGVVRTVHSGTDGGYVLTNLPIGPYQMEVTKDGFTKYVQSGIVLQVNSDPAVDASLKVGAVSEQVVVEANATQVETRSSAVGVVVDNQRILDLPLNGRSPTDLVGLSGGAVDVTATSTAAASGNGLGNTLGGRDFGGAPRLQIAGGSVFTVGYMLDGSNFYNMMNLSSLPMPFPDALQEFKVSTTGAATTDNRPAEVSAVTKSGTNQFHGDAFEFIRNDLTNARQYFATTNSTLKRNQFGGAVGGPIRKNKIFFFGGYQQTTVRADPGNNQAFLPTAAMLKGDWSTFEGQGCNGGQQKTLRPPFNTNQISPASYSKAAVNLVNKILASEPTPNPCGLVTFGSPTHEDDYQWVSRVDYQMSDKHSLFVRYTGLQQKQPAPLTLTNNPLTSTTNGNDNLFQSGSVGDTYLFGPNIVNAFRIAASRVYAAQLGPDYFSLCSLGVNMYCGFTPGQLSGLSVTSGFTLGNGHASGISSTWSDNFEIKDDVSMVRGSHQMSFGASLGLNRGVVRDTFYAGGRFIFSGGLTGAGLADLMLGQVTQLTQSGLFDYFANVQWFPVLYATDTWKASRTLTVNYGVRWEPYLPAVLPHGQSHGFDFSRFQQNLHSSVYPGAPAGMIYFGDQGYPSNSGSYNNWNQFAPRIGLAWDPKGDGKMSVRASYALSYSVVGGHWEEGPAQDAPFPATDIVNTVAGGVGGFDNPWQNFPGGNPFPRAGLTFPPSASYTVMPFTRHTPYTESWNLGVQRQFGDWLVSATYLGSQQVHEWFGQQLNPARLVPNTAGTALGTCPAGVTAGCNAASNTNQRRLFSQLNPSQGVLMDTVNILDDGGTGSYHGLLVSAQKRLSQGFSVQVNYTWSHCIDESPIVGTTGASSQGGAYTDPTNRAFDRGDCIGDRRRIFNLTALAQTPKFSNRTLRLIGTGWQMATIYRIQSGAPLNILAGSDRALNGLHDLNGNINERGSQILPNAYLSGSTSGFPNWLNPAAFAIPAFGTLGTSRRNSVVGPAFWIFDAALSRQFRVTESQHVELRFEAFNLLNKFRPGNPNATLTSAQFGQIRSAYDPRIMQFALKYVF